MDHLHSTYPPWISAFGGGSKRTHDEMNVGGAGRARSPILPATNRNNDSAGEALDGRRDAPASWPYLALPYPLREELRDAYNLQRPVESAGPSEYFINNTNIHIPNRNADRMSNTDVIDLTLEEVDLSLPPASHHGQADSTHLPVGHPPLHSTFGQATRGPRFDAEIIDLSEDSPTTVSLPEVELEPQQSSSGSPEIEFVAARPVWRPRHLPPPRRTSSSVTIDVDDDDDEIQITDERTIASAPLPDVNSLEFRTSGLQLLLGAFSNPGARNGRFQHPQPRTGRVRVRDRLEYRPTSRFINPNVTRPFVAPDIDFSVVGFDMGLNRDETASPLAPPPPPAPIGYTRTPEKGGVYVCENCDEELCGGDSDVKRQVWVGKCGHMYCHECTQARHVTKNRKLKQPVRTKAFKECVAKDCGRKLTSRTAMIQLFL